MTAGEPRTLRVEALTAAAFAPFGDVIAPRDEATRYFINGGQAERFHDLAVLDALAQGGRAGVSIVRVAPSPLPLELRLLERHRLGSQAFVPLGREDFLVVVAPGDDSPRLDEVRAFLATGGQGVNYRRGTWHHPVIAVGRPTDFVVLDRVGAQNDCEEWHSADTRIRIHAARVGAPSG